MEHLNMKIGTNLPKILLEIAQENILNGDVEKGITIYTNSLHGFNKEYALMCIKNEAVLIVNEDEQTIVLNDDVKLRNKNKENLYDWNKLLNEQELHLVNLANELQETKRLFENINDMGIRDIENYSLQNMMLEYFSNEQVSNIGVHNLAAKLIKGDEFAWNLYGNGSNIWHNLCDNVESDNAKAYEKALYYTVKYVNIIRIIHKEFIKFNKQYHFLVDNGIAKRILYVEQVMNRICSILKSFSDLNKGYYHGMCDKELYEYKKQIIEDMKNTVWGNEYLENNFIWNNIEDRYDAGWLSPDGEFIGANGDTSSMIHMCLAEDIWNGNSVYGKRMREDDVSIYCNLSPEYWLGKEGWLKIHHDEIYGYFKYKKNAEITHKEDKVLYCPTKKQIEMICKYVDKFYNGKFYMFPKILRTSEDKFLRTSDIRQMDEIALHNAFTHY